MASNSVNNVNGDKSERWYFTKEELENTPSRKAGYDAFKELSYRQQAANFIQDLGQRLRVSQLCINTAIVYMHRFYVFHSFTHFPWYQMAAAALFLAAKVEEQPRKLEAVIRMSNACRNPKDVSIEVTSERYQAQSQDLIFNENVLLQTLGFDVAIDHPHTHVVRCCHLVRASKDLAQTSYFMASNSLHLTTMCLQYKPTVVACFCIHVACKWSNWEIPMSNEDREWFSYVDISVTAELLQQLTKEFLVIFESCPSRLKEKIMAIGGDMGHTPTAPINSPFDTDPRKIIPDQKDSHSHRSHDIKPGEMNPHKHRSSRPHEAGTSHQMKEREYRERKERERLAMQHGVKGLLPGSLSGSKPLSVGSYSDPRAVSYGFSERMRNDPNRQMQTNQTNSLNKYHKPEHRRPEEYKGHLKSETDNIKKHLSSVSNKSGAYLIKPSNSTSQKIKSPFSTSTDVSKSVPKPMNTQPVIRSHQQNGSNTSSMYNMPVMNARLDYPIKEEHVIKQEPRPIERHIKEEPFTVKKELFGEPSHLKEGRPVIKEPYLKENVVIKEEKIDVYQQPKRPSLFSPEKSPPPKMSNSFVKEEMKPLYKNVPDAAVPVPLTLSPVESPNADRRTRAYSSSSEPELRPVMKKIDQVEGFENIMRDATIGIEKLQKSSDFFEVKSGLSDQFCSDTRLSLATLSGGSDSGIGSQGLVNGIETNPTLISHLLKEAPPVLVPCVGANTSVVTAEAPVVSEQLVVKEKEREHHHHKSKKKNKEKHKHKDRSKEEKEKKKKHKDKSREKHRHKEKHDVPHEPEPIKIKIQRDKIQQINPIHPETLKIRIPKDKIKTEGIGMPACPAVSSGNLKLKIPKEVINNCTVTSESSAGSSSGSSRKRERDRSSPGEMPPSKVPKSSYRDSKQNGRHFYNKVAQPGDGDASVHRLAESKYTKGSS